MISDETKAIVKAVDDLKRSAKFLEAEAEALRHTAAQLSAVINNQNPWHARTSRVRDVIERAAATEGLIPRMLLMKCSEPRVVRARTLVMVELRGMGLSLPQIGRALGGMHHTTVLHHLHQAKRAGLLGKAVA